MGSSSAMDPNNMDPAPPLPYTASPWGVPNMGSSSANYMGPGTTVTPMNTTLTTGPSGFNDSLSYGNMYGNEAVSYGNTLPGDAFYLHNGSHAEYSTPTYSHGLLSSPAPHGLEQMTPMDYEYMHEGDMHMLVDSVEGEGSEDTMGIEPSTEGQFLQDDMEFELSTEGQGIDDDMEYESSAEGQAAVRHSGQQASRGAGSSRRTRAPARRVPAVLPRTATTARSSAGKKVTRSGGVSKLNKDGRPRKARSARGPLCKWTQQEVLERALMGLVLAANEDGIQFDFAKAAKYIGVTGTAFQQALLKIHKKLCAKGYDLPSLTMRWKGKKRTLIAVLKGRFDI